MVKGSKKKGVEPSQAALQREVAALRRLVHVPEEKSLDVDLNANVSNAGTLTLLSGIAQGTDVGQRVGNAIRATSITFRGRVGCNTAVTTYSVIRLILIRDTENSGSVPALADIMEATGGSVGVRAPMNFINRDRFKVLWEDMITVAPSFKYSQVVKGDLKLNLPVKYRGTGNTVAAAAEGTLYWVWVSDEATNTPSVALYTQLRFIDS